MLVFPSPCGVNIVAKFMSSGKRLSLNLSVSVPLRGKYRGEGSCLSLNTALSSAVSVPLRGKYRGEDDRHKLMPYSYKRVSVPLRGKYRGEATKAGRSQANTFGFRPLAG